MIYDHLKNRPVQRPVAGVPAPVKKVVMKVPME